MPPEIKEPELDLEAVLAEDDKPSGEGKVITLDDKGQEIKEEVTVVLDDKQPTAEDTINELKAKIKETEAREAETREKISRLENERAAEVNKATAAISDAYRSKEITIESSINANTTDINSLKRQLKEAREKGDIDSEIDTEQKLMEATNEKKALLWEKNRLAAEKAGREEAIKNQPVQPTERQYSTTEKSWIDSHPRYSTDDEYQSYVWSVDTLAKRKGIQPDTPAYYEFLNAKVDKMFPETEDGTVVTSISTKKTTPASSTAAPPSRSASTIQKTAQNGKQVRLSPEQLEAADFMGMTPAEYAQDLINQEKERAGRA